MSLHAGTIRVALRRVLDHGPRSTLQDAAPRLLRGVPAAVLSLWADRFDLTQPDWLDKEVFPDPPEGERRVLDLVARLTTRQPLDDPAAAEPWLALLHIEIDSAETVQILRPRMPAYYTLLRQQYALPVLPIALYLRVGLDGVGVDVHVERFWDFEVLQFRYLYVGLPALDAERYLHGDNPLGVALTALMRVPAERAARLKAEALSRLVQWQETEYRRFLLCECVQAYLPLTEPQLAEFEHLLHTEYKEILPMVTTWYEQGLEKGREQGLEAGREQGLEQGQRRVLQILLEKQFGALGAEAKQRLASWPPDRLADLALALLGAPSLRELGLED